MFSLHRHGPLAGCLVLSAAALLIPFKPSHQTPPDPPHPPRPPVSLQPRSDITLQLGANAQVHAGLSQGWLPPNTPQTLELALDVTGQTAAPSSGRSLVLCIDRSGSMSGPNIQHARHAAAQLVSSLTDQDEIALITFSTRPSVDLPLRKADAAGKHQALQLIGGMEARGGTHVSGGLSAAIREAEQSTLAIRRIVVLSDGVPTEGDVRTHVIVGMGEKASHTGVVVSTFGVGSQSPGGLMERIATVSGGNFRFIRDGGTLRGALAAELDATSRVAVQAVMLSVRLPQGATFRRASGATAQLDQGALNIRMGDVPVGETRHVVLTLATSGTSSELTFPVQAFARVGATPLQASDALVARTSNNAAEVASSVVTWVRDQQDLAQASEEVREAAGELERGDKASGGRRLAEVATAMEKKAASQPALAPAARKLRSLADEAPKDADQGAAANIVHQNAFDMMR